MRAEIESVRVQDALEARRVISEAEDVIEKLSRQLSRQAMRAMRAAKAQAATDDAAAEDGAGDEGTATEQALSQLSPKEQARQKWRKLQRHNGQG